MLTVRAGAKFALLTGLPFVYYGNMSKSKPVVQKKRGRPATGADPIVQIRMPAGLIEQVEAWARHQETSRSDAVRRLVEFGLQVRRDG
jgi:hypothetical protein